jgi:hypothetical protein
MIDRRIGKIKLRRGLEAERRVKTFQEGELIYVTDKKRLYIGDGVTVGGIPASNKNFITNGDGIPSTAIPGDIIYRENLNITYIVGTESDNYTLKLIKIFDGADYTALQTQIDQLNAKVIALQNKVG